MRFSIGGIFRYLLGVQKLQKRLDKTEQRVAFLESEINSLHSLISVDSNAVRYIVPFLSGGLGNQLFQVSCAYALSRTFNFALRLNYNLYASYGQGQHPLKYKDSLYQKLETCDLNPAYAYSYSHHDYKEIVRLPRVDIKLEGYYQSSKYFRAYSEELRNLYVFPPEAMAKAREFLDKDPRPAVGIHIRLGDYLNHPGLQAYTDSYYVRAAKHFPQDARFIVCSDQPEKACEILRNAGKSYFLPQRKLEPEIYNGGSELGDLALLIQCKNLILSNSTFSYWGYFLGTPKSKVVAPKLWFNRKHHKNHADIYEKEWILE